MTEMAGEKTEIIKGSSPKVFLNRLIFIKLWGFLLFFRRLCQRLFTQMTSRLDY